MKFKKINTITGWLVFAIATVVYLSTIEPSASFWDCGEFILSAFKLEVGHPPGAPLFMMIGHLFSLFAGGNVEQVPIMLNSMSALFSGFTILFLFWTITHMARKIAGDPAEYTLFTKISVLGSGVVGALAYTFSDTFWFSAVEGEVYAFSSLFTAVVFWAVLKWEDQSETKYANRWLVFIAYLMGLSIGVHLLNLLAIPAIGLVYYFRKYPTPSTKGIIYALLASAVVLGGILYVIVPGVLKIAVWFELFFVNQMGLPFNTGILVYGLLLVSALVYGLWHTYQNGKTLAHTIVLCVSVIILGYCSYGAIVVRSAANTPMDQNDPQNIFNLQYYLNREQYGDRPLIVGQCYSAPIAGIDEGAAIYVKGKEKYEETGHKIKYKYDSKFEGIFPRMYSSDPEHIKVYKDWGGSVGTSISTTNRSGQPEVVNKPTFGENLRFFFSYQMGYMYFRYFMWNFAGRQNDLQDIYSIHDPFKGNWISGIRALDEARLGPQDMPATLNNKAHNRYYLLPLLLGLAGLVFQFQRRRKDFWVVMALFVLTGIAIVVYLNQSPNQPRERDYAYAGSFYAFAIWIGLGVMALVEALPGKLRNSKVALAVSGAVLLLVPGIMAKENWDDHDRSNRYVARDLGANFLNSCAPNAVIFTNGDNDTFPLWYAQEVEGIRTDVRVVNLSYFSADWYIDQTRRKAYESDPFHYYMSPDKYLSDKRNVAYVDDMVEGKYVSLKDAVAFVASDDPKTKRSPRFRESLDLFPAKNLIIPVNREKVLANGTETPDRADKILPEIRFKLNPTSAGGGTEVLYKNHLMLLDMIATNDWSRPIYFAITVTSENYLGLDRFLRLEGFAYRLVPEMDTTNLDVPGNVEPNLAYDHLIHDFRFGNVADPKVYKDENMLRQLKHYRTIYARVASDLLQNNRRDSALKLLDYCMEQIPASEVPMDVYSLPFVEQYFAAGDTVKAVALANGMIKDARAEIAYFFSFPAYLSPGLVIEKRERLLFFRDMSMIASRYGQTAMEENCTKELERYYYLFTQGK